MEMEKQTGDLEYRDSISSQLEQAMKSERRDKRLILALFGIGIILSIFVGRASYDLVQKQIAEQNKTEEETVSEGESEKEEGDLQFDPINHIAYIQDGEIILLHKKNYTKRVFSDPAESGTYSALAWKNKRELTYAVCEYTLCSIKTRNIQNDTITDEKELEAQSVLAIRWSHKGQDLAYLYDTGESIFFDNKHLEKSTSLWTFPSLFLGSDFNGAQYIRFSPDDTLIFVVNTHVNESESSIIVFGVEGTKLVEFKKENGQVPTFPFFISSEMLYYKRGPTMYRYSLETEEENILTERIYNPLHLSPSFDRSKITYWTYDPITGFTTVWVYEIGSDLLTRLQDNALFPLWLDDTTLLMQPSEVCYGCLLDAFEIKGFFLMDVNTRFVETIEEEGAFSLFSSENL